MHARSLSLVPSCNAMVLPVGGFQCCYRLSLLCAKGIDGAKILNLSW
jgi:hypothetical protein